MNIVNKVTLRHLKQNKKRTLVTIVGTIISVAMITAVATLAISFLDLMKRQTIEDDGEWHVLYKDVNTEQIKAIEEDEQSKAVILSSDLGYAPIDDGKNESKPYLFIKGYNAAGFQYFPVKLINGRLPRSEKEVVISEEIASNAKLTYDIGEKITLEVGKRYFIDHDQSAMPLQQYDPLQRGADGEIKEALFNQEVATFTVVGVIKRPNFEPTWSPGYSIITYIDEDDLGAYDNVNASVVLEDVESSLYKHAEDIAAINNIEEISFNNTLLRYYGVTNNDNLKTTLYSLAAIIMTVIVIGSVALIYNAFGISVSERSRHLGMLSSVGATKKQKRNSVFFEGIIIGFVSIPIGFISGIIGIGVTFWYINKIINGALGVSEKLNVMVTPASFLVASTISMVTILISTYLPARKASKISAIDAIRQSTDIKLSRKTVKTSKIIRKLFGMEAEIGLKNIKRNKRRYRVTVFSLVISIILFLSVSFFTDNLKKSLALSQDGINFDIKVSSSGNVSINDQMIESIKSLDHITKFNQIKEVNLTSWIDEEDSSELLHDEFENGWSTFKDGKFLYYIEFYGLDEASFKEYANEIGIDPNVLMDGDNLAGIVIDTVSYHDLNQGKFIEAEAIRKEVGEKLALNYRDWDTDEEQHLANIDIAALTNKLPMGIMPAQLGELQVIVLDTLLEEIVGSKENIHVGQYLFLKSSDPTTTQHQIEDLKNNNMYLYNVYQERQREDQIVLLMSVFTYGFIILITGISIANIFNTISTSISLRKREFAMLKSVGMTPKSFNKMINYESLFYGFNSILYGIPISVAVMYFIHLAIENTFNYGFTLPWFQFAIVVVAVFVIVGSAMLYSISKVRKENIIETLRQESI